MHVEKAGDGEPAARICRYSTDRKQTILCRSDPPDSAVFKQEICFGTEPARDKIEYTNSLEQHGRCHRCLNLHPDGNLLRGAAFKWTTPQFVAGHIKQRGTVRRKAELIAVGLGKRSRFRRRSIPSFQGRQMDAAILGSNILASVTGGAYAR